MSFLIVICSTAITLSPVEQPAVDRVDLVEINHFYDDQGRLVFDQVIYYDWSPEQSRYHVRDWRLLKTPTQIPLRNWRDGGYVSEWTDFKQRDALRQVRTDSVRETWTQHDPELVEREFLAQEKRRELSRVPAAKSTSSSSNPQSTRPSRPSATVPASSN